MKLGKPFAALVFCAVLLALGAALDCGPAQAWMVKVQNDTEESIGVCVSIRKLDLGEADCYFYVQRIESGEEKIIDTGGWCPSSIEFSGLGGWKFKKDCTKINYSGIATCCWNTSFKVCCKKGRGECDARAKEGDAGYGLCK